GFRPSRVLCAGFGLSFSCRPRPWAGPSTEPVMSGVQIVTIAEDDGEQRLDRWFRKHFPHISQIQVAKICRKGEVRLDGARVKPADRIVAGQTLRIPPLPDAPEPGSLADGVEPASDDDIRMIQDAVIWQDDHIIAINKPPGLPSQGGSGQGNRHVDHLSEYLRFGYKDKPQLIHRLDKDTSGVLLLGRTPQMIRKLNEVFRGRDIRKIYWAAVAGVPKPRMGTIRYGL